jgi:2'-5' RNA ligase
MPRRIFIAINLPEQIKKELSSLREKWPELPCRWTKKENLHITLIFLGYVKDEELPEILEVVKTTASKNKPFLINLKRICYGPPHQSKHGTGQATDKKPARMVWAEGEKSIEMAKLQTDLENALQGGTLDFKKETRAFAPHITLGRLKLWEFRQMEPEEKPEISEEISLNFEVSSIEIMESKLKPQGPDYFALESMELAEK